MSGQTPQMAQPYPNVLAVVVLYRTSIAASKTLQGLARAATEDAKLLAGFDVLLWDNSPEPILAPLLEPNAASALPFKATYHHAAENSGVAGAYNGAMQIALQIGYEWLLLLDDDTSVTAEFLRGMCRYAQAAETTEAAVVPFLYAGEMILSPRLWGVSGHRPLPRPAQPYVERRALFAANSGSLVRVSALEAIGGYSARFWLDYSDIYVFHQLHVRGYAIRIAADLALEHDIAALDYDGRMTPARYAGYLAAEGDFLDLYRGPLERALHLLRLAVRVVRQRRYSSSAFSKMTLQALLQRLRTSPRTRLRGATG